MNMYAYVYNDPINGVDPFGLERHDITRGEYKITVESDLESGEIQKIGQDLPDQFFEEFNGKDFGEYDPGRPDYIDAEGNIQNDDGFIKQREALRLGYQISKGIDNNIIEEQWAERDRRAKSLLYAPFITTGLRGLHHPLGIVITDATYNGGIQQIIATTYHERLHYRYGRQQHAALQDVVDSKLRQLGFRKYSSNCYGRPKCS